MIIKIPVYVLLEKVGSPTPVDHELLRHMAVVRLEEFLSEQEEIFKTEDTNETKKFNKENHWVGSSLTREEALEYLRTRN
jgi:hypothetical protein